VRGKSRSAQVLGRVGRMPSVLDRTGTRWLFQALTPPPKVIVLVHRGRRSGRLCSTPVSIMADPAPGDVVVSPMWSKNTDWYLNLVAGGLVEARVLGEAWQVEWRELDEAERRAAGEAYPIYSRIILRALVRLNRLEGDPEEAVLRALPMLILRRVGS
jgi:deazaflavin-dependent oxidoreductase (nitroreductase family)